MADQYQQGYYQQQQQEQQLPFTWQEAAYFPIRILMAIPEVIRKIIHFVTRITKT